MELGFEKVLEKLNTTLLITSVELLIPAKALPFSDHQKDFPSFFLLKNYFENLRIKS